MATVLSEPRTHVEVLPNGLTLLLREAHRAPVAEIQIWVDVGSADERPGEAGLAHFHEHMLFKGTRRRGVGDLAGEVEGAGGRINAYTSFDATVYHVTVPTPALATGLDVLADAVQNSSFDPEEIDREIEVVLEEIRRGEDSPSQVLGEAVFREAFAAHPYRAPILGTPDSVASFDRARVRAFFERWYGPDRMTVVAAGDFDAAALAAAVRDALGAAAPVGTVRTRASEPRQTGLRSAILARPFERARLDLAWHSVALSDADTPALDLLAFILGEGDSSRLVRRVRERDGSADSIDAWSYTPRDAGLFSVSVDTDTDRAHACIEAVAAEIERVRAAPVSHEELEKARANFLASEHYERESVSGLAQRIGSFQVLAGDHRRGDAYLDRIRGATADDLWRVARTHLAPERLTVGAVVPDAEADALRPESVAAAVRRGALETARFFAAPRRSGSTGDIRTYDLDSGAVLHVLPRRDVPVVAVRAAFLGGSLAETEETAGLCRFLTSLWLRGTRSHSAADFARTAESRAVEIDGFSGRSSLGLTLEVPREEIGAGLDLFAEVLVEPAFDEDEIDRERRETLAAIERREDRLAQRALLLFAETHFREHPYRLPILGKAESVARFDREGAVALHERLIQAKNLVLAAVGDVDPDEIASQLSSRLADLPAAPFEAPSPPIEPPPREIRSAEIEKGRAQVHLVIGFRGLTVRDDDRFALEVIAQLLAGQGGRLFLELRDRRGLAYAVSATNVEGVAPGFFHVYIATAPDKREAAERGMFQELQRLIESAPADDELERAKRYLTGNFAIDEQRNAARAMHIALDARYGLGPGASRRYPDQIAAVTKDDILRVARRLLTPGTHTRALVR